MALEAHEGGALGAETSPTSSQTCANTCGGAGFPATMVATRRRAACSVASARSLASDSVWSVIASAGT